MSTYAIEKALWQALSNPKEMKRLRDDAQSYLEEFNLDEDERSMILTWEVDQVISRNVNPLLLMSTFTAVNGMQAMGDYLSKLNRLSGAASGH